MTQTAPSNGEMAEVWSARLKLEPWSSIAQRLRISTQVAKALHRAAQSHELASVADMRAEQIDRIQNTLAGLYGRRDEANTASSQAESIVQLTALLASVNELEKQILNYEDMLAKVVGTFAAKKTAVSIDSLTQRIEEFTAAIGQSPLEIGSQGVELVDFAEILDDDVLVPPTSGTDAGHGGWNPPTVYGYVEGTPSNRIVPKDFGETDSVESEGDVFNLIDYLHLDD